MTKIGTFAVEDCCLSVLVTGELVQDKRVEDAWPPRHMTFTNALVTIVTAVEDDVFSADNARKG